MVMKTLNDSELKLIEGALGFNITVHATAIVRVYESTIGSASISPKWELNCWGAAAVVTDKSSNSHYIKVVELNNQKVNFSQELYQNFEYTNPRSFFHTFETEECVTGLSFADDSEANDFFNKVNECKTSFSSSTSSSSSSSPSSNFSSSSFGTSSLPPPPPTPSNRIASTRMQPLTINQQDMNSSPNSSNRSEFSSVSRSDYNSRSEYSSSNNTASIYGTLRGGGKKDKKKKGFLGGLFGGGDEGEDLIISEPRDFRHLSSIGWSPNEGSFEIRNIPTEWKKLFQAAGIKKSDLKDKDTAKQIMSIIDQHGGNEALKDGLPSVKFTPPPPPGRPNNNNNNSSNNNGLPPPPPPPGRPNNSNNNGLPPPPPPKGNQFTPPPPPPPSFNSNNNFPPPPPPFSNNSGPPPPPPPMNNSGPPPPPPPSFGNSPTPPPPPSFGNNESTSSSDGRGSLLAQIQKGRSLKKVDANEVASNNSNNPPPSNANNLANTLAKAMESRRAVIKDDTQAEEDDWNDDDWND